METHDRIPFSYGINSFQYLLFRKQHIGIPYTDNRSLSFLHQLVQIFGSVEDGGGIPHKSLVYMFIADFNS